MSARILAPSILAADFTRLGDQIRQATEGGAQWIHCDIMDGHFVPNISYGAMGVDAANRATDHFMDVHLMVYNPDSYTESFVKAGADLLSVHVEAVAHLHRSIQHIKKFGIQAGVAINPATSLTLLDPILPEVDLVVLMSVNPGFGGQAFIPSSLKRIEALAETRAKHGLSFKIEVDGGVTLDNIRSCVDAGADVLVAGSSVFAAADIPARVRDLLAKMSA
jgi:ribulose-phosphate 3-epimerase